MIQYPIRRLDFADYSRVQRSVRQFIPEYIARIEYLSSTFCNLRRHPQLTKAHS